MPDDCRQMWNVRRVWHCQSRAEIIPEHDADFCAGLVEAEKSVAAVATGIASGAAAHFSLGDLAADIVLRAVGMQRNFGAVEHHEQFAFVGVQAREQTVEGDESGLAGEDAIEARPKGSTAL